MVTLHSKSLVEPNIYGSKRKILSLKMIIIIHNQIHKFGKQFHIIYLQLLQIIQKQHKFFQQKLYKYSILLHNKQIIEINRLLLGNNKSKNTNNIIDFCNNFR